jgi:hypothetical protein
MLTISGFQGANRVELERMARTEAVGLDMIFFLMNCAEKLEEGVDQVHGAPLR